MSESSTDSRMTILKRPGDLALVAALLVVVGSIGPWDKVTVLGLTVSKAGTSGDGIITLILAIAAGAVLLRYRTTPTRRGGILAIITGALAAAVGVYDLLDITNGKGGANGLVQPAWGLYLTAIAGIALTVLAFRAHKARAA